MQALGVPMSKVYSEFGIGFHDLLVDKTLTSLYNPVLPPATQIKVCMYVCV